ncbi:MAG: RagB/SusD family nutrient uptake outer membrane protein [Daejeonella sp.]
MKKKILYIGTAILFLAGNSGCKTDFLNLNPLDQISTPTFWKNETEVQSALAGCYSWLVGTTFVYGSSSSGFWEGLSDNGYNQSSPEVLIGRGEITSTTGSAVSDVYTVNYQAIANYNNFLANIQKADFLDGKKKAQYIGEVKFLRAYAYFYLAQTYGGVILSLKPEIITEAKRPQNTKEEVLNAVMNDLDSAIAGLPNTQYTGHVVKGSALALKTKVLLTAQRWQDAAQTAKEIIDSKVFSLSPNYKGMFDGNAQDNNPEIMFSARYLNPTLFSNLDQRYTAPGSVTNNTPNQNFVDEFETIEGKPITQSALYDPQKPFNNRDPRLLMSVFLPSEIPAPSNSKTGFIWKKYIKLSNLPADYNTRSDQDIVMLRYADVLLMYAEAENETSGPNQTVYDAVNLVRARPGVNMPLVAVGLSKDQMRKAIMHERRVEFGMEGLRYWDLKRWHLLDQVIPTIVDPGSVRRKFDSKNYLWPFPQSEIDRNPYLTQNPGY